MSVVIEYRKACRCDAAATRPGITYVRSRKDDFSEWVTVTLHPGPVCDGCGKPWKRVKKARKK